MIVGVIAEFNVDPCLFHYFFQDGDVVQDNFIL